MAEFETPNQLVVHPGEPIVTDKTQKEILKALQENAKNPQQGYDIYVKIWKNIQERFGNNPCKPDLTLAIMFFYKLILNLSKEEAQIAVGAGYDLYEEESSSKFESF